jgi:hypothetical protein
MALLVDQAIGLASEAIKPFSRAWLGSRAEQTFENTTGKWISSNHPRASN